MRDDTLGTPEQLRDPDFPLPLSLAIPLGIQHVLAMFVSNVTPAIILAGAAGSGFGSGSPDQPELLYLVQMAMLFAGLATLLQTVTLGPVGAGPATPRSPAPPMPTGWAPPWRGSSGDCPTRRSARTWA